MFITDGVPFPLFRKGSALQGANSLKASGVSILAIGDGVCLRDISSPAQLEDRNFLRAAHFAVLKEIRRLVGTGTCVLFKGIVIPEDNFSRRHARLLHDSIPHY